MTIKHFFATLFFLALFGYWLPAFSQDIADNESNSVSPDNQRIEKILNGMEQRYSTSGFSANFIQQSTLKAMDITDTATGTLKIKRPGMMRWEYQSPDPQVIITDGDKLWIYRPEDKQVMVGEAPSFFKDGKGAGFLSDMKLLRNKFSVFLDTSEMNSNDDYHLKLYPEDQSLDVAVIFLVVDPATYIIKNIVTYNTYEDETRIRMTDYNFDVEFPDHIFDFSIPEGTDILELE
ncbi:MAG: outer membrane lipoprotein carrier protein LolA [Desulfobacterales bacterium]